MQDIKELLRRLLREECGQDLLEYALLAATIGIAGAALFPSAQIAIRDFFQLGGQKVLDAWVPPCPGCSS